MPYAQGRVINFKTQEIMTINELLGKPVWQMTGEELLFLAQHGNMSTSGETAKASSKEEKRYVYGLAGIARLFGCSLPTANRIKQSGKINRVPLHKWGVRLLLMPTLRWNWQGER